MKRTSALITGVALMLALAACGSGDDQRTTLINELRADAAQSGATEEEIDCVVDAISGLDADQLQSIKDSTPDAQTQEVMVAASEKCFPTQ